MVSVDQLRKRIADLSTSAIGQETRIAILRNMNLLSVWTSKTTSSVWGTYFLSQLTSLSV